MRCSIGIGIFLLGSSIASAQVRKIEVIGDQIVTVRTATNIATIIQVPDKPNSLVVGDQNSFKVEYLDRAITIKPLHGRARSNLFIYTDARRFSVRLVTGDETTADYLVYLSTARKRPPLSRETALNEKMMNESLTFEVMRGRRSGSTVTLEFRVKSRLREAFKPEWVWMTQKGATIPIHLLALERDRLDPEKWVVGVLQLKSEDFDIESAIRVEIRRKKVSFLVIRRVSSWK